MKVSEYEDTETKTIDVQDVLEPSFDESNEPPEHIFSDSPKMDSPSYISPETKPPIFVSNKSVKEDVIIPKNIPNQFLEESSKKPEISTFFKEATQIITLPSETYSQRFVRRN
ncbi:hypothetical protein CEXT_286291 [Caerostris extrusa]|uniref:Uncharacterized protein n=1 Tax=Caerostris extrusa TaxID=172846 RepID=A0AAV4NQP6_CAEEX|nr:hypothetical protein CEXT_286291 [Caerostris extrusa]